MQRRIITTKDGSHSIQIPELNVTYHSTFGAIQESLHVFIKAGLYSSACLKSPGAFYILEPGFGTGLNALLTAIEAEKQKRKIYYTALETEPLTMAEAAALNYPVLLGYKNIFDDLHSSVWDTDVAVNSYFTLCKQKIDLLTYSTNQLFNLVYFDVFAPEAQPELWTPQVFEKLFLMMAGNALLVTYCSKGIVRRAMQAAGFIVKKIPGPPGKREIVMALKQ